MLHPIGAKDHIRPHAPKMESASGLHLVYDPGPEVVGSVVALGPFVPPDEIAIGHVVLFSPWAGQEIRVNDTRLLLLEFSDLAAILTTDAAGSCPTCGRPAESPADGVHVP